MGRLTTITCDRCGVSEPETRVTSNHYLTVGVCVGGYQTAQPSAIQSAIWCRECATKAGIILPPTPVRDPNSTTPSIEDKIVEILNNLGFTQSEG